MIEIARGIYQWSRFSEEKQLDFNGHYIDLESAGMRVIIDPPMLSAEDVDFIARRGPVSAILITNRDHLRESERYRTRFQTRIVVPEQDAPLMDIKADGTYTHGDRLFGELEVIHIPDGKSPGESALLVEQDGGILILGDALIGKPAGSLSLLPPDKFADAKKARDGVAVLLDYPFEMVLVGDGVSIRTGGKEAVRRVFNGA